MLEYVEAHLGGDTSLRQLAELARLSPDHFATLFRQSIGLPPHRYVLERRIARAKELLAGDQLSLAEICHVLGYTSPPDLTTKSRKLTGATPCAGRGARSSTSFCLRDPRRLFRDLRRSVAGK